ncbi:Outer dense fiber protein 3-like protein 2 [Tritrichomonas musculus]|uniref:Outer dense fiber protein 3-like protein 2 n=1 Tax=Tritrichomonas musculus TaxID=1915356 RepID=A0ABR2JDQ9_9EUKA
MVFSTFYRGKNSTNSPGPGSYNIPDQFGSGPRYTLKGRVKEKDPDPEPPIIKMPTTLVYTTTTFGFRAREKEPEMTPGPNVLPIPFGSDGKKYSFRFKYEDPPNTNPGPADYTISREFPGPKQTISEGKRWDAIDHKITAPPGFDIPSMFEKHKNMKIGDLIPLPEPERNGPGPAKYKAKTTIGKDTPLFTVPKGPRESKPNGNPGPADYQRLRPLTSESRIGTAMKFRTKLPQPDKCDYPYHKYPGCISPRKFTHGTRPATSYETLSPGPKYDKKSSIEIKQKSIGSKPKSKNPFELNPGPADYFDVPLPTKDVPFCGFYGPTDRFPAGPELNKEKEKPGPADYDSNKGSFYQFNRGYYFTSRKMEDYVPDTAGPYIEQKSSLGGPKYTIGKKEEF